MRLFVALLFLICSANLSGQPLDASGSIYVSYDHGASWSRSDAGFPAKDAVNAWIIKDQQIYAATNNHGVVISSDKGKSWSKSMSGLPQGVRVTTLLATGDVILAGTYQHGIFISSDGSNWHPFNAGVEDLTIRAFHKTGDEIYAGGNDGVYVLQKSVNKWLKLVGGYQVNDFVSDGPYLYAATHLGVIRTKDAGFHWDRVYHKAVSKIGVRGAQICLLDYSGIVHYSYSNHMLWFKDETYLPIRHSYRLTPFSQQILIEGSGIYNNTFTLPASGLPPDKPFNTILETPFGVFASANTMEGC